MGSLARAGEYITPYLRPAPKPHHLLAGDAVRLSPEQEQALAFLVEAFRRVGERQPFYAVQVMGTHNLLLVHPGVPQPNDGIYPGDVETLGEAGLLRVERTDASTWRFDITVAGFEHYAATKAKGGPQALEETVRSYIDDGRFAARHPRALEKWRQVERLVWTAEGQAQFTTLGHLCREAMQLFATSLLARRPSINASTDPTKTVARIRAAVAAAHLPEATGAVCDALIGYWGSVSDLAQRQEHGAQKEGQPLAWADGRTLVFHTLFVMVELDRIIS